MNSAVVVGLLLAAPPRLVAEVQSVQEAGVFPVPGETADDLDASVSLFRSALLPSLEGRYETRNHELALRFAPRFLLQVPVVEDQPILALYRGAFDHGWRFDRGAELRTNLFAESGRRDFVFAASAGAFAPATPILASTRFGGSVAVALETGAVESFTISVAADYEEPWEESEDAIFATYRIVTTVEYSHYLARRLDGVLDVNFEHLDFFEEDVQSRRASLRVGLTWRVRPNVTWDARGGVQVIVGDQLDLFAGDGPQSVQDVLPAGGLRLDWTFLQSAAGVYTFAWDTQVDAFVDPAVGTFVPQIGTSAELGIFQPWGAFRFVVRGGTPIGDTTAADLSFAPTYYAFEGTLDLPISEYVNVFASGRFSQRAPVLGADDFAFAFTEAVGTIGLRLWWSSGRDPRLPRPSQTLDSDEDT